MFQPVKYCEVARRQVAARATDVMVTSNRQDVETGKMTEAVIGAAMRAHSALGPGLLESADGLQIDVGYRIDLLVEDTIIMELKAVEKTLRLHEAQLLSYLKLSGLCVGLLVNFCVPCLRLGIKRMVNNLPESFDR